MLGLRSSALAGIVAALSLVVVCVTVLSKNSEYNVLKQNVVKYACTNSVDCLDIPVVNSEEEESSDSPSDFLKGLVQEIASQDDVPKEANHFIDLAKSTLSVAKNEVNKAKVLREQAKRREEKAQRLEQEIIKVNALVQSRKSIADWYDQQAQAAEKLVENQKESLDHEEGQHEALQEHIQQQREVLQYVDQAAKAQAAAAKAQAAAAKARTNEVYRAVRQRPYAGEARKDMTSSQLQNIFEFGGKLKK